MSSRFIQIHALSSYPAVLLNRDDTGMAKRMPFGGTSRLRISSQCLKRHWRMVEDRWSLREVGAPTGLRSREIIEREVLPQLRGKGAEDIVAATGLVFVKHLYGPKGTEIKNRQALLLGTPEITYLTKLAAEIVENASDAADATKIAEELIKSQKANLSVMKEQAGNLAAGIEAALFGRMVTSDTDANTEAPIHVAHAISVHKEESENDYFTVVDDLTRRDGEGGSGGIFDTELTSGLFYSYVVVDVPGLVGNLGGDRALAGTVVEHLIHLIATVSPGAKRGSTAPYSYADLMLVERGARQPRSLANAFRKPVALTERRDAMESTIDALSTHLSGLDAAYGAQEERDMLSVSGAVLPGISAPVALDALASKIADSIRASA
ncbi:MAG: type I-E CRISPR-associated protein Cas7/Cse4/CasC [Microvirga sp.]